MIKNIDTDLKAAQKSTPPSEKPIQMSVYQHKPMLSKVELGEMVENIANTTTKLSLQLESLSDFLIKDKKIGTWVKLRVFVFRPRKAQENPTEPRKALEII